MKLIKKNISAFIVAILATFTLIVCSSLIGRTSAVTTSNDKPDGYFYSRITYDSRVEKFYSAFEALVNSGEFKNGKVEYELINNGVTSSSDALAYLDGANDNIIKAYSAGRDAYIMDNPDLFYVDLFGTSLSIGQQGSNIVAYLDSSRSLTLYNGNINTTELVNSAIQEYEAKLEQIVVGAKQAGDSVKEQIEYVNKYISEITEYSFGTKIIDGKNVDTPDASYISTAYGAIVNGKAICGGYSKAFKAVMDRLDIPCVCVQGYAKRSESSSYEPHMWNYVQVEGMWYAVDVTYNDTSNNLNDVFLVGGNTLFKDHIEDNVISSSGFELEYPALKPYDYGDDTDDNGMTIIGEYIESSDYEGLALNLYISFEDKGTALLREEGKYFVFRTGATNSESKEVKWSPWFGAEEFGIVYVPIFADKGNEILCILHPGIEYIQFALVDYAPDDNNPYNLEGGGAFYPNEPDRFGENAGKPCYFGYKEETLTEAHFIGATSAPYRNSGYGTYKTAPGAISITPSNTGTLRVDGTYDICIVYSETLELEEYGVDVGIDIITSRGNDTIKENVTISNFNWDGDKTISFTLTPSKMYIHNSTLYYITPSNLVGVDSKKVPFPVTFSFSGKNVVCSKIFNDGRLYMSVYGDPLLLDNSDVSITDFKDENENYYAESQRSQLILVASKPSNEKEMEDVLKRDTELTDEDIIASSSYEINLQICGVVQTVPNGSYMQVAFGFPEGYDPNNADTTFKIYHYKREGGVIVGVEEIPVIVNQYGIIARVTSFSPFTIVQVKNTSPVVTNSTSKSIYAFVNGQGGTITTLGKSGIAEVSEDFITYDITAEEGYQIGYVSLNGKIINASQYVNGQLVLSKDAIDANNMLEVGFVTTESAKSYSDKGIKVSYGKIETTPSNSSVSTGTIVGCIMAVVVIIAGGFAIYWFVFRKKHVNANKK